MGYPCICVATYIGNAKYLCCQSGAKQVTVRGTSAVMSISAYVHFESVWLETVLPFRARQGGPELAHTWGICA